MMNDVSCSLVISNQDMHAWELNPMKDSERKENWIWSYIRTPHFVLTFLQTVNASKADIAFYCTREIAYLRRVCKYPMGMHAMPFSFPSDLSINSSKMH
jgi:hypothetical protein